MLLCEGGRQTELDLASGLKMPAVVTSGSLIHAVDKARKSKQHPMLSKCIGSNLRHAQKLLRIFSTVLKMHPENIKGMLPCLPFLSPPFLP